MIKGWIQDFDLKGGGAKDYMRPQSVAPKRSGGGGGGAAIVCDHRLPPPPPQALFAQSVPAPLCVHTILERKTRRPVYCRGTRVTVCHNLS